MLNPNNFTTKSFSDIYELDRGYVGTENYLGVAFFWNFEYRHYLRDASTSKRKKVHSIFLKEGLDVRNKSDRHFEIIKKVTKLN
jgi:hypothetical protein